MFNPFTVNSFCRACFLLVFIIISTRGLAFTMPPPCIKFFGVNALRGKPTATRFTKFAGYLHWVISFSGTEISHILKNKMAAAGISLQSTYLFLLAGSHR